MNGINFIHVKCKNKSYIRGENWRISMLGKMEDIAPDSEIDEIIRFWKTRRKKNSLVLIKSCTGYFLRLLISLKKL